MPTNQEWLHKLANESPDELKAWFDAEHFECPSDAGEAAIMSVDAFIAEHADETARVTKTPDLLDVEGVDSRENLGSEPSTSEVFGGKGSEVDSREKLEADVDRLIGKIQKRIFSGRDAGALRFQLRELLDRQAAITERECLVKSVQGADAMLTAECAELQVQVDELTDSYEASSRALEILTVDKGNLTVQVDKLTAELEAEHALVVQFEYDNERIKAERDNLADDLLTCNREREHLRKNLGIALDHAHDICALVDIGD